MIAILASAKTIDAGTPWSAPAPTHPEYAKEAAMLARQLQQLSVEKLAELMDISPRIAQLNAERYRAFTASPARDAAKPALLAYQGDVYRAMGSARYDAASLRFAQKTLRIVSGLYGVLRPLDLIQPYRLEMATKLQGTGWSDLYAFWRDRVTSAIDRDSQAERGVIVNLASQEYADVLDRTRLRSRVLTPSFKQQRGGRVEMVPILAKRARGLMADHIVRRRLAEPEGLKAFDTDGYRFTQRLSSDRDWVFVRRAA